jgi:hypothetical protein
VLARALIVSVRGASECRDKEYRNRPTTGSDRSDIIFSLQGSWFSKERQTLAFYGLLCPSANSLAETRRITSKRLLGIVREDERLVVNYRKPASDIYFELVMALLGIDPYARKSKHR